MDLSNDLSCEAGSLSCCCPQPPRAFSITGLRLYFPTLEPWVTWSASLPDVCPVYLCMNVVPQGLIVVRLPAPLSHTVPVSVPPWPHESSPPRCPFPPLLLVWMNVYFLFPWYRTSLPFDFLSVLVVRRRAVCLPTPPSWFSR